MGSRILITGATDGIGLEAAKLLAAEGHTLLLHGRSSDKLASAQTLVAQAGRSGDIETYRADLSVIDEVVELVDSISSRHGQLDVLINNAGVFRLAQPLHVSGLDARFLVNTLAPYVLTTRLLPLMPATGRVVNVSSAAQSPVNPEALAGREQLSDGEAYAQSKLAITMWSFHLARSLGDDGPSIIAVNPGSFLGSKMVREAYGIDGKDISTGARVLARAALDEEFAGASGRYFDNDIERFAQPHPDAVDDSKTAALVALLERLTANQLRSKASSSDLAQ